MKYSSVMSGVFHERVIICEADADCMFYGSLLDLPCVHGERHPDVLFVHANGKHRMATLARTLFALDVPVTVVADVDILKEEATLRGVVESLGGDWSKIQVPARVVRTQVEQQKPSLSVAEVREHIGEILTDNRAEESLRALRGRVEDVFRKASPWDLSSEQVFRLCLRDKLRNGSPSCKINATRLVSGSCQSENLKDFCKSVGNHGPGWLQCVLKERDLGEDPELERAREFVRRIWDNAPY